MASAISAISLAGRLADRLDGLAALAEHDLPLALALDEDRLLDAHRAVLALLPLVGLDRRVVGQLLVQPLVDLLARDLGGEHAQRRVGDLVLRDRARGPAASVAARSRLRSSTPSPVSAETMKVRSNGTRAFSAAASASSFGALDQVDLVEDQDLRAPAPPASFAEDRARSPRRRPCGRRRGGRPRRRRRPRPRRRSPWRGRAGASARRCRACRRRRSAPRPRSRCRARRARVVCTLRDDDRDLRADERVEQRRLAGIRRADEGDEAAARLGAGVSAPARTSSGLSSAAPRRPAPASCRPVIPASRDASTRLRAGGGSRPRPARPRASRAGALAPARGPGP